MACILRPADSRRRVDRYHGPPAIRFSHYIRIHIVVLVRGSPVGDDPPGDQVGIVRLGVVEAFGHVHGARRRGVRIGPHVREHDSAGERFGGHAGLAEIGLECANYGPGSKACPAVVLIPAVLRVEEGEQEVLGRDDRGRLAGIGGQPARHHDMDVAAERGPLQRPGVPRARADRADRAGQRRPVRSGGPAWPRPPDGRSPGGATACGQHQPAADGQAGREHEPQAGPGPGRRDGRRVPGHPGSRRMRRPPSRRAGGGNSTNTDFTGKTVMKMEAGGPGKLLAELELSY